MGVSTVGVSSAKRAGKPAVVAGRLPFRGQDYPRRPAFFAHRFQRLLLKVCATHEIGCDGFALLSVIVLTEDSRRYRRPPAFWNSQLQSYLGLSYKQLDTVRRTCIDAGWLHYEAGGKSKAGIYWVIVPPCFDDFDDAPLGESTAAANGTTDPLPPGQLTGIDREGEREAIGRDNGQSFLPVPGIQSPTPSATPVAAKTGGAEDRILLKLKSAGIALVRETLDQALAQGLTLDAVEQVVDYACSRPAAWGPGALRMRLISRSAPLLAPHQGWPAPAPAEAKLRETQRMAECSAAAQKTRESDAGRRAELKQLELDFGPQLDALPEDAVFRLLGELRLDSPFLRRAAAGRTPATLPTVRPQLLRALAARSGQQN